MLKAMISQELKTYLLDLNHPVGSYYETSDTSFNPNVSWGGTWVEDSAGRNTVAYDSTQTEFNSIGKTGGSKFLQEHNHTGMLLDGYRVDNAVINIGSGTSINALYVDVNNTDQLRFSTNKSGTGGSGNLSPYIVVKRWHRTA